ncbi:MAG TPA: D-alanyl-D-alanine carboxypeptidase family protein [bacterium]|nr:D-alanyl-D-alanine carboxypeptidase family protein [bacterium]
MIASRRFRIPRPRRLAALCAGLLVLPLALSGTARAITGRTMHAAAGGTARASAGGTARHAGGGGAPTAAKPWLMAQYRRAAPAVAPVRVTATAALLMDARTGEVLYSRNPHLVWPPASTTKVLTALVALESMPLDSVITISPEVAKFRVGSVVGLPPGAKISLHDLLYGLMLQSGNDVALAVAEGVSGSVPAFVDRMNAEARRLGARQTHFTSPHGLYDPNHYTTAYDLALITRVAMQNPTFEDIVRTRKWTFQPPTGPGHVLWNHNRLLSRYAGADGVKTGYVDMSGETLVASATRNGWRLIAVLLHSGDMWGDAQRLLSYGFDHYRSIELARAGEEMAAIQVRGGDGLVLGVVSTPVYGVVSEGAEPVRRVIVDPHLRLPIRRGARVGEVEFYEDGRLLQSAPLVAARGLSAHTDLEDLRHWAGVVVQHVVGAAVL